MLVAIFALSACGSGGQGGVASPVPSVAPVADSASPPTPASPAPAQPVTAPVPSPASSGSSNSGAPFLSGQPLPDVQVQEAYIFTPVASDPAGGRLTFSIVNMPRWATFDAGSGKLSGKPSAGDVGSYSNIVISVSNGTKSTSLKPFSIVVNQVAAGSVSLSWVAPAENVDGTVLTDLAGFAIRYGRSAGTLSNVITLKDPSLDRHVVTGLSSGVWYFAVSAINTKGVVSSPSSIGSTKIG